jgi:TonB-linked SusC/RagA family outer membrane protein
MKQKQKSCKTLQMNLVLVVSFMSLLLTSTVNLQARGTENKLFSTKILPPSNVSGKVVDTRNSPIEGATVLVKGSKSGVVTDAQGNFTLKDVADNASLSISAVGYLSKDVPVRKSGSLTVILVEQVSSLTDVVVVGYGTQSKKDLTGAVVQIKATQLENENPRSVGDMLRGNAPGLDVGFDASTKGSNASLQVRGKGTLTASSSPLIVLDGVIYPGGLEDINPNDIATIDVLKDASSAAVFGARSANGVVLITTKRGKGGKPVITFNDNVGFNKLAAKPHLLTGDEMLDFRAEAIWSQVGYDSTSKTGVKYKYKDPRKLTAGEISQADWLALTGSTLSPVLEWLNRLKLKPIEVTNYQANKMLDWENLIYNNNALQHDHTVSISQRREDYNYYFSLGYLTNEGLTKGDVYKTFRTRLNLESTATKFLTIGVNFQYANRDESSVPLSMSDVTRTTPWGSIYADDGVTLRVSPNDDPGNNTNPFMEQFYTDRMYRYNNLFGTVYVKGKLPWGFSYQANFSPRFDFLTEFNHQAATNPTIAAKKGIVDRRNQTTYSWQSDNILRWNQKYKKHSVEATFLFNAEKFQFWNTKLHAENFAPNDNLSYHSVQSGTAGVTVSSDDQVSTGDALMGRINYNYDQRYFFTATTRRDGYSAFGQQNPRATFPSVALAWAINEEKFMKSTQSWLDYLKIRGSYGENGNREIGRYAALSNLSSSSYVYVTSGGVTYNGSTVQASNLSNPNLKWERNSSINYGFDYSILKGKISGSVDMYDRITKDLLVNRSLPSVVGFSSILVNLGEVENKGTEITVNTVNVENKNFTWKTSFGIWWNKNTINHLYGATPDYDATGKLIGNTEKDDLTNQWFIGHAISAVYNYNIVGVWQISEAATAAKYGYKPGDFKLEDTDKDGKYTIADKQFLGETTPKYSFNFRNDFRVFKNFDFSFTLNAKIGQLSSFSEATNSQLNGGNVFYDRSNFYKIPYWTPTNPINDYAGIGSNVGGPVSWNVYRKSSFVRLNNMSLAYNLPQEIARKHKLEAVKFYMNVVNARVFTDWIYFDPENKNGTSGGAPTPYTVNFGLNLTL